MPDRAVDLPTVAVQVTFYCDGKKVSRPVERLNELSSEKISLKGTSAKHDKNGSFRSHQIKEKVYDQIYDQSTIFFNN